MRSLLLSSIIALSLFACKKEEKEQPQPVTPVVQQDAALLGAWVADSLLEDGSHTLIPSSTFQDTLFVTADSYKNVLYVNGYGSASGTSWTTSGDSIFASSHYKYQITGTHLWTYEVRTPIHNQQIWYHKK